MDNFPVAGLGIIRAADDDGVSSKTSPKSTRTKSYLLNWNAGTPDLLSNKNWLMFFGAGIPISSETGRLWPGTFGIFLQLGRRKFYNIFNKIDQEFPHRECLTVKGLEKKHREQLWIQIEWTEIRKLSTSRQERMDLHYF